MHFPGSAVTASPRHRAATLVLSLGLGALLLTAAATLSAQTGGQGALEGTITDPTGAVIPNATVTAIDQASGVNTVRQGSGAGLYSITPLVPGIYTVQVKAPGFEALTQKNIEVNGLLTTGLNLKLSVGSSDVSITVNEAPPQLQTTSATLGAVITDETYEALPLVLNNQQRDPSAFATLAPGAQGGARAPIFSGTGNYLAEVYIDGIPTTTANQQGDNRVISNGVPVESVDQLQIVSSGPSAEYQGAGAIGFTIKSGGNKYHGQVVDLVRNTIFDTWGFAGDQQTVSKVVNGVSTNVPAGKPVEHQNELSAAAGGPIPLTRGKGFFFVNYDKFHSRQGVNPGTFTIPTPLMTQGNFTELGSTPIVYNPLTNNCVGSACTRQVFTGLVNGLPVANVIPSSYLSPISQYEQKFLPTPNLPGTINNYLQGGISGFDNHELLFNVAYSLPRANRLSFVYSHGVRQSAGYGAVLPLPYTTGSQSIISPTMMILEYSVPITPRLVNQFKYGFTRFPQPVLSPTDQVAPYRAGPDIGIGGLPTGQAAGSFPGSAFSGNAAAFPTQTNWTGNGAANASHNVTPNAYTMVDNVNWQKGRHNMTFGFQTQWLEDNTASQTSPSGIYTQGWSAITTSNFAGSALSSTATGYAYASFLLGAVNTGATSVPLFQETAGRFHPFSPYFQDDWKLTPNFTLNLGLRWDYLPPYHEAQDRWSFFNPNATNSITGTPGQLEFAGSRGADISCQCRTPVHTYFKNFGPRLGAEWAVDPKTVFRAGFAVAYSRAGGVGGRGGDSTGSGQTGFGSNIVVPTAITTGATSGPSYYLNNGAALTGAGLANTNFGGPGFIIPAPAGPSAAALNLGIGNVLNGTTYLQGTGAPGYPDPYLSGRAPEFIFFNFAMQKVLTKNMTLTVTYSGSESHFVGGAGVAGFWSGQLDPQYVAALGSVLASDGKTNILNAPATPANLAIVQKALPSYSLPYPAYLQPATGTSTSASIGRALRPYPQYSTAPGPTWDNIANINYHAFQLTLAQREFKGVSYTVNYTYSRNVGDDGTTRSAFAVPAAASSSGTALPGNNRADRDLVVTDVPQNLNAYGLAKSPFGKGKIGGDNWLVRTVAGGWQTAGIFSYSSGNPILVTGSGCTTPNAGTCMPDVVPGRDGLIRINGGYGAPGVTYANYTKTPKLDTTAFQTLQTFGTGASPITKIGSAPRSHLNVWGPSRYNLDMALQRSFNVTSERVKFIFRADCFDVTNKVTFSLAQTQTVATAGSYVDPVSKLTVPLQPGMAVPAAASPGFGALTGFGGNRRFQLSGRVTF